MGLMGGGGAMASAVLSFYCKKKDFLQYRGFGIKFEEVNDVKIHEQKRKASGKVIFPLCCLFCCVKTELRPLAL